MQGVPARGQEALPRRAPVHRLHREPARRGRAGRHQQHLPHAGGEERAPGQGQGDGQVQGLLLCGVRDRQGSQGGGVHGWDRGGRGTGYQNRRRRRLVGAPGLQ